MAYESGEVNSSREALVEIRLGGGQRFECVIDTGFNGDLMLPRLFIDRLGIPIRGRMVFEIVGGTSLIAPVAYANIEWLDEQREVEIIVSDGDDALIGTQLLAETTLSINYVTRIVSISKGESRSSNF